MVLKPPRFHGDPSSNDEVYGASAQIETAVANALAVAGDFDATGVEVTLSGSTITLTGSIKSDGEESRLIALVRAMPGVSAVANHLVVNGVRRQG